MRKKKEKRKKGKEKGKEKEISHSFRNPQCTIITDRLTRTLPMTRRSMYLIIGFYSSSRPITINCGGEGGVRVSESQHPNPELYHDHRCLLLQAMTFKKAFPAFPWLRPGRAGPPQSRCICRHVAWGRRWCVGILTMEGGAKL